MATVDGHPRNYNNNFPEGISGVSLSLLVSTISIKRPKPTSSSFNAFQIPFSACCPTDDVHL